MGTSLSGLTPATTFDGLLKTSDNEPLDGTLKTISDGSGVDSVLQLSNSALNIGGAATIETTTTWVEGFNSNLRLTADSPSMQFKDTSNTAGFMIGVSGASTFFSQSTNADFTAVNYVGKITGGKWNFGSSDTPSAVVSIKGSGATASTTSLLVQNSGGGNIIKANDDGRVLLGAVTDYQNHLLELNGSGLGNSQTLLRLQSSVNFSGAYTGIGFTNSTNGGSLSSEIRAYRESYGNAMTFNFAGNEMLRATSEGNLGIGETTPTARLQVKGSGNDNTTTALLVQNSDATQLFKVDDAGSATAVGFKTTALTINAI